MNQGGGMHYWEGPCTINKVPDRESKLSAIKRAYMLGEWEGPTSTSRL